MEGIAFQSSQLLEENRRDRQNAREKALEKAKRKYEKKKKEEELAKLRGEDTWMLPMVLERLDKEQKEIKKSKSKKHKKLKKKKREGKKKTYESDSSSNSGAEPLWVEKVVDKTGISTKKSTDPGIIRGPTLQRDSWMEACTDFVPAVTRQELKEREKKEAGVNKEKVEQAGQHERELNPYWKYGGNGLPEENQETKVEPSKSRIADFGLAWLQRAYKRCQEQSAEEGRSLEEVAAERWGSLKKLKSMLKEAEKSRSSDERLQERNYYSRHPERQVNRHETNEKQSSDRRSHGKISGRYNDGGRRLTHTKNVSVEKYGDAEGCSRMNSIKRCCESTSSDLRHQSLQTLGRFMKPGEMNNERCQVTSLSKSSGYIPKWKKKCFQKPVENEERANAESVKEPEMQKRRFSSEDSCSSLESSSSESEVEAEVEKQEVVVLTEQQMNELGAKILRAELMEDEELVAKLKAELELARVAREQHPPSSSAQGVRREDDRKQEEILLTRTNRSGMTWPLASPNHTDSRSCNKRKKFVSTHDKHGQRQKYFDDDDKFDFKTLVEREKMGTAEDQNMMFARLAGRAVEKTDDDYQLDDMFTQRAAKEQSEDKIFELEKARAIFEHRKLASAMEKCQKCFEHVPKHLIIAIGTKVYLCLPNCKSLTDGHCFIVPMQHLSASTSMDEDIWQEIITFRQCLVQMFEMLKLDVIFMETSMHLKRFPHACIECIPVNREDGALAPMFFKKAILESDVEWAQNKRLIDLKKKGIRNSVPKGFPYFCVDFGMQNGFAHVIEDEKQFPLYFGKEIIGGMIDAEPRLWRKPLKETFEDQRQKVLKFAESWKPFDWTNSLRD